MVVTVSEKTIRAYAFRERTDLQEVRITDEVESIREGAFYRCSGLEQVLVGHGVSVIEMNAFVGLPKNVRFIWLSRLSYKSKLYRIIPDFDDIAAICAPYLPFSKTGGKEKIALACGFILHPEYEQEYNPVLRENYRNYILHEFTQHLNILLENNLIMEVMLAARERGLIADGETLGKYISHARARITSRQEKRILEKIEAEEKLLSEKPDRDKKLLRFIKARADMARIMKMLEKEGVRKLPPIRYRDSEETAPHEIYQYILYRYIRQWPDRELEPEVFERDEEADRLAEMLDPADFQAALRELRASDITQVRRMVPLLRFTPEDEIHGYMSEAEKFSDYEKYGRAGITARRTLAKAAFLNESPLGILFAFEQGMLPLYNKMHRLTESEGMLALLYLMEKQADRKEELYEQALEEYRKMLYARYVQGDSFSGEEVFRIMMQIRACRELAEGLLWHDEVSGDYFRVNDGESHDRMVLAHPSEMTDAEIEKWQGYFKEKAIRQPFEQLWIPAERYEIEDADRLFDKYHELRLPLEKIRKLAGSGFELSGDASRYMRCTFYGKCYLTVTIDQADETRRAQVNGAQEASYRRRELNEAVHLIDELFYPELIEAGRLNARIYAPRLDREETERALRASLERGDGETTAILLERIRELEGEKDELELDW